MHATDFEEVVPSCAGGGGVVCCGASSCATAGAGGEAVEPSDEAVVVGKAADGEAGAAS